MTTRWYSLAVALAAGVAIAACGGDESPQTPPPPEAAAKPATPSRIPVVCIAKWATGPSGTFKCEATGPQKDRVKLGPDTLKIDAICVSDPRLTSVVAAAGKTVPLTLTRTAHSHCAQLGGTSLLPEQCTCVPPAGGDCNPPADGFVCIAAGSTSAP